MSQAWQSTGQNSRRHSRLLDQESPTIVIFRCAVVCGSFGAAVVVWIPDSVCWQAGYVDHLTSRSDWHARIWRISKQNVHSQEPDR